MYITDIKVYDSCKSAIIKFDQVGILEDISLTVMVQLSGSFPDIIHIKVNNGLKLANLNLIELKFFRAYPYLKQHILFFINNLAIWLGLSDITIIKVNYGRTIVSHLSTGRSNFRKPQKAHLHPLRDVCVQNERNPSIDFQDLLRKRNMDRLNDGRTSEVTR